MAGFGIRCGEPSVYIITELINTKMDLREIGCDDGR
jgi:hypothetical protein